MHYHPWAQFVWFPVLSAVLIALFSAPITVLTAALTANLPSIASLFGMPTSG